MAVRIGLAFNLKPAAPARPAGAKSESPSSDEPPSRALRPELQQPDLYAEWDEPATINAVERALSTVGQVYRLEANASVPARLALLRPDFVFNIAEGLYGPNRESHVPAICEFLGVPCHASDPLTLSLALHKARAKEILSHRGVPTSPFVLAKSPDDARHVPSLPALRKAAFEARQGRHGEGSAGTVQLGNSLTDSPTNPSRGDRDYIRSESRLRSWATS